MIQLPSSVKDADERTRYLEALSYTPTMSEALGAKIEEAFRFTTTRMVLDESEIAQEERQQYGVAALYDEDMAGGLYQVDIDQHKTKPEPIKKTLTRQQYEDSPLYRKGIEWKDGWSETRARVMSSQFDERRYVDEIIRRRSPEVGFGEQVLGFGASLIGSLPDPINLIPFTGGLKSATIGRAIALGVAEGAAGTALADAIVLPDLKRRGEDVGFADFVSDILAGAVLGGSFGGAGYGISRAADGLSKKGQKLINKSIDSVQVDTGNKKLGALVRGDVDPEFQDIYRSFFWKGDAPSGAKANVRAETDNIIDFSPDKELKKIQSDLSMKIEEIEKSIKLHEDFVETRKGKYRFHGTSFEIVELKDYIYSPSNIYGQGFYTTDAFDIAEGYTRKGRGAQPSIYEVNPKRELKIFDLEKRLTLKEQVYFFGPEHLDEIQARDLGVEKTYDEDIVSDAVKHERLNDGTVKTVDVLNFIRRDSQEYGLSKHDVQEIFDALQIQIMGDGYDGWSHIGGILTKQKEHDVIIYFNPNKDLNIKKIDFEKFKSKDKSAREKELSVLRSRLGKITNDIEKKVSEKFFEAKYSVRLNLSGVERQELSSIMEKAIADVSAGKDVDISEAFTQSEFFKNLPEDVKTTMSTAPIKPEDFGTVLERIESIRQEIDTDYNLGEVERMRNEGTLTEAEELELGQADEAAQRADKYEESGLSVLDCVIGAS